MYIFTELKFEPVACTWCGMAITPDEEKDAKTYTNFLLVNYNYNDHSLCRGMKLIRHGLLLSLCVCVCSNENMILCIWTSRGMQRCSRAVAKRSVLVSGTDSLRNVRVKFGVMLSPHVGWGNKKKRPAGQVRVAGVHTNVLKT